MAYGLAASHLAKTLAQLDDGFYTPPCPTPNVVRAKDTAISCRERLHWKCELNQEFSADAAMLSLRHENIDFRSLGYNSVIRSVD